MRRSPVAVHTRESAAGGPISRCLDELLRRAWRCEWFKRRTAVRSPQRWPLRWGIPADSVAGNYDTATPDYVDYSFTDVVRMRGGEYFYAPSRNSLRRMGG